MIPKNRTPTHPGEILLNEFLEPMGISQMRLAEHIEVPVQRINELVNGKRGITPETAWKLAGALGTTPEFWTNLQAAYELAHGRPDEGPGLVDPLWEIRRGFDAVMDAVRDVATRRPLGVDFVGIHLTRLEATPKEVRCSLDPGTDEGVTYERAPRAIARALEERIRAEAGDKIAESPAVKEALDALRAVRVHPRKLNTVESLIERAGGIEKVRIWKQPAIGASASIAAARSVAQGRARNPWVGAAPGLTVSLTATQYEELKRRGAIEEKSHL
jgi:addiction module HigA family antidote